MSAPASSAAFEARALVWGQPGTAFGGPWSAALAAGEVLAVLGPNGAGKTTLFRTLIGALEPLSGEVLWAGRPLRTLAPVHLARSVAFVPQQGPVLFELSAADYVMLGRLARKGRFAGPGAADRLAVAAALERLGLGALADRPLHRLSGGERQMVALARALAQQAAVLLLDEPTSSLDFGNQDRVLSRIEGLAADGLAVVFSTHQPDHAQRLATRVLAIDGRGHARFGTSAEILSGEVLSAVYGVGIERIERAGGAPVFVASGR
ncbi:ATP-binding cassette domain-containing protein [Quisquiliibacterium transsilvanicum]|uniref:Iron complex transport system ATP-binding protein n=1 Tax=Quisquiliibacterium transsilvanicum TaxID=1549638 RepID=A0A7W8HI30_9BURK|nr:iron complex transport system ATP-binding protein [Quisquiliibacterium transsilvanicum]